MRNKNLLVFFILFYRELWSPFCEVVWKVSSNILKFVFWSFIIILMGGWSAERKAGWNMKLHFPPFSNLPPIFRSSHPCNFLYFLAGNLNCYGGHEFLKSQGWLVCEICKNCGKVHKFDILYVPTFLSVL